MTTQKNFYPPEIMAYETQLGVEGLGEYVNKVWRILINMKPGSRFSVKNNVKEANTKLFVLVVKLCMSETKERFKYSNNKHEIIKL